MLSKLTRLLDLRNKDEKQLLQEVNEYYAKLPSSSLAHLKIGEYSFTPDLAIRELGLDRDFVEQLVEDYVVQVIKAVVQFETYLLGMRNSLKQHKELDYTPFRELAHKNLGVARNLRIEDAQVLLYELMKKDDLEYLVECLEALKFCTIRLRPKCAYDTIKLLEVKSSFEKC